MAPFCMIHQHQAMAMIQAYVGVRYHAVIILIHYAASQIRPYNNKKLDTAESRKVLFGRVTRTLLSQQ